MAKRKMTKAQLQKRSKIAEAIHREHPEMSDEQKFKIATSQAMKKKRGKKR